MQPSLRHIPIASDGYVLMVVPGWSHNPPDSFPSYIKEPHFLLYFFSAVNHWVFLVSLIAWLLTIKLDTGARAWTGRATLIAYLFDNHIFCLLKFNACL